MMHSLKEICIKTKVNQENKYALIPKNNKGAKKLQLNLDCSF